jgi:hypothetical protein
MILHNGSPILSRTASDNPPTVTVSFPNGGQSFGPVPITITWAASDPDGDPLSYLIQYSGDDGATWDSLMADWTAQSFEVDGRYLPASTNGRFRVIASDLFHSASDQSDGSFTVSNQPPSAAILRPAPNQLFFGSQQIVFEAVATDVEDSLVDDLEWSSSADGVLGLGQTLIRQASDLSEGTHLITVTATDSAGATNSASVPIDVRRLPPPALSVVEFLGPAGDRQVLLSWPALVSAYMLETTDDLLTGVWVPVPDPPVIVENDFVVILTIGEQKRFYRLRAVVGP